VAGSKAKKRSECSCQSRIIISLHSNIHSVLNWRNIASQDFHPRCFLEGLPSVSRLFRLLSRPTRAGLVGMSVNHLKEHVSASLVIFLDVSLTLHTFFHISNYKVNVTVVVKKSLH
jgi:hypothetical protein